MIFLDIKYSMCKDRIRLNLQSNEVDFQDFSLDDLIINNLDNKN